MKTRLTLLLSLVATVVMGCSESRAHHSDETVHIPITETAVSPKDSLDEETLPVDQPKEQQLKEYIKEEKQPFSHVADAENQTHSPSSPGNISSAKETKTSTDEQAKAEQKAVTLASKPEVSAEPKAASQTDGFNFHGYHFPLSSFSGDGKVPQNTPYIYRWTDFPTHYLIERISPAGNVIRTVEVGDKVTVNNQTYTVTHILRNVENDYYAVDNLFRYPSKITFQTCEAARGKNGKSLLTIWFAQ